MMKTKIMVIMMAIVTMVIMLIAADLPSSLSGETNWWQILGRGSYKYYHYKRELYFIWFSFIKVSTFSFITMFLKQLTQS